MKRPLNLATPESFCDVFDRLEREGVRYVVTGGVAVVLHGHARPVADLDLVIDPAPAEAERALHALARVGFVPSLPLPPHLLTVLRLLDRAGREVDVFVRSPVAFEDLWADSRRVHVGAGVARVVSLDCLLRAKRFNARPRDLLDIAALDALAARERDAQRTRPGSL